MDAKENNAQLLSCKAGNNYLRITLKFAKLPSSPIAPSTLKNVAGSKNTYIELHKVVQRENDLVTFIAYDSKDCPFPVGEYFVCFSWWTPWQLEIAQSNREEWRKTYFEPSDSLAFNNKDGSAIARKKAENEETGNGFIVSKGWDHEHCGLCWKTISESESDEHFGYVKKSEWVCSDCYEKYINSGFGKKLGDLD